MKKTEQDNEIIAKLESEGNFGEHLHPFDTSLSTPVTEDFPYIPKGWKKVVYWFKTLGVINPFTWYINHKVTHTKVYGRKNLKGVKSGVATCNHVFIFDCLVVRGSLKHKMRMIGHELNNRNDLLGERMRVGGMIPLSSKLSVMRKFNSAVEYYLKHNHYILFYPEQAMWNFYDKPRPLADGAFFYAVKNNVPIIPTFITYRPSKKGADEFDFDYNILAPIYPDAKLSAKENVEMMKQANFNAWKDLYEKTYNKKLSYDIKTTKTVKAKQPAKKVAGKVAPKAKSKEVNKSVTANKIKKTIKAKTEIKTK